MHRRTFNRIVDEVEDLEAEGMFRDLGPLTHGQQFTKLFLGGAMDTELVDDASATP
jgi:hypothetical protein